MCSNYLREKHSKFRNIPVPNEYRVVGCTSEMCAPHSRQPSGAFYSSIMRSAKHYWCMIRFYAMHKPTSIAAKRTNSNYGKQVYITFTIRPFDIIICFDTKLFILLLIVAGIRLFMQAGILYHFYSCYVKSMALKTLFAY